jgi:hypothetical protein
MPNAQRYFRFYQADELKELVTSHGFEFLEQTTYTPHHKT